MTREGGDITADRANGNFKTQIATLYGNVTMHDLRGNFAGLASASVTQPNGPATMTADQVRIDGKAKVYSATGHVHYVQQNTTVDADRGTLNDLTHLLYLDGHVHISQGLRSLSADHVVYDTIAGTAHAESNVTMQFPSTIQTHLATPKPIRIPRIPHVQPTGG
jgi:lipopolysaccharide assembly outer membrane protein LptD (OstA)